MCSEAVITFLSIIVCSGQANKAEADDDGGAYEVHRCEMFGRSFGLSLEDKEALGSSGWYK